jgi:hypothetical protein
MPIPLSQPQFLALTNAAAALFPPHRDAFLCAVASALAGQPIVGDGTLGRAIRDAQVKFARPEPERPARWERSKPDFGRFSRRDY